MERITLYYIIDVLLGLSFAVVFFTGLIKFLAINGIMKNVFIALPAFVKVTMHDWAGIIMGILVFIHLALHWKWIVYTTKGFFKKENNIQ